MGRGSLKEKLEAIRSLVDECLDGLGTSTKKRAQSSLGAGGGQALETDLFLKIANKAGDCEERQEIQKYVMDKRGAEGKVLLSFYISYKYFSNAWLTSGDIERITSQLGIKIDKRNVSNYLVTFRPCLESGAARKRGGPTPYRLNRRGVQRFEEIIHAKEC